MEFRRRQRRQRRQRRIIAPWYEKNLTMSHSPDWLLGSRDGAFPRIEMTVDGVAIYRRRRFSLWSELNAMTSRGAVDSVAKLVNSYAALPDSLHSLITSWFDAKISCNFFFRESGWTDVTGLIYSVAIHVNLSATLPNFQVADYFCKWNSEMTSRCQWTFDELISNVAGLTELTWRRNDMIWAMNRIDWHAVPSSGGGGGGGGVDLIIIRLVDYCGT